MNIKFRLFCNKPRTVPSTYP